MRPSGCVEVSKEKFYELLKDEKFKRTKGWRDPEDGSFMSHRQVFVDTEVDVTVGYCITSSWNPNVHFYLKERFLRTLPDTGGVDIEEYYRKLEAQRAAKKYKEENAQDTFVDKYLREKHKKAPKLQIQPLREEDVIPYTPDISGTTIDKIVELISELWEEITTTTPIIPAAHFDIREGWMGTDEDPYWGFSCKVGNLYTGREGFLRFWEEYGPMPIKYNGWTVPVEEYDRFIKHCKGETHEGTT